MRDSHEPGVTAQGKADGIHTDPNPSTPGLPCRVTLPERRPADLDGAADEAFLECPHDRVARVVENDATGRAVPKGNVPLIAAVQPTVKSSGGTNSITLPGIDHAGLPNGTAGAAMSTQQPANASTSPLSSADGPAVPERPTASAFAFPKPDTHP